MNIVVAGASGYIGQALIPRLLGRYPEAHIVALSRSDRPSDVSRLVWKACDLFSMRSLETALPEKIDLAFYLVHSMQPTAQLDQGSFADYDLILADNFARVCKPRAMKQLIYLGGLMPEGEDLSRHLESRLEVEKVFADYQLPITTFRAGLIFGSGGSSMQILLRLVRRLPAMLCPAWTQTLTTPVDLDSVIDALVEASTDPIYINKIYDLAGCEPITYLEMMREMARFLGLRRQFIRVPVLTPTLSRLWVTLITQTSKNLVYPLVESLEHKMVARPSHAWPGNRQQTCAQLIRSLPPEVASSKRAYVYHPQSHMVRSVQRLPLPAGRTAEWVRQEYVRWLPQFMRFIIRAESNDTVVRFSLFKRGWALLILQLSLERSHPDRQLLYIRGGALAFENTNARLEFREVLNKRFILAAIHEYKPRLPWFVYAQTQARMHLFVMRAFRRHLSKRRHRTSKLKGADHSEGPAGVSALTRQ